MSNETQNERDAIISALYKFAAQRPGLEFGNYGDVSAYRAEMRSITKDLHHARALLSYLGYHPSIGSDALKHALQHAYSGRLSWNGKSLDYCTGQYFPTEYRRAVCAVIASALWNYFRENGAETGDKIRAAAKRELPRAVAKRWFN